METRPSKAHWKVPTKQQKIIAALSGRRCPSCGHTIFVPEAGPLPKVDPLSSEIDWKLGEACADLREWNNEKQEYVFKHNKRCARCRKPIQHGEAALTIYRVHNEQIYTSLTHFPQCLSGIEWKRLDGAWESRRRRIERDGWSVRYTHTHQEKEVTGMAKPTGIPLSVVTKHMKLTRIEKKILRESVPTVTYRGQKYVPLNSWDNFSAFVRRVSKIR